MQIKFGQDAVILKEERRSVPVVWDTARLINGHCLIAGKSGTGKTHTLRKMLAQLEAQAAGNLRIHIIDSHGDIEIPGASTVKFSEATQYGFNPLEVSADPDFGGVRKRIQYFLGALNRTSRQLGTKQESVLRGLLQDLYAANGFYDGKPESWKLNDGVARKYPKKFPTLEDAVKFASFKQRSLFLGTSERVVKSLEELNKNVAIRQKKSKQLGDAGADKDKLSGEIERLTVEAIGLFTEHARGLENGHELDGLLRYDSRDVLKSVVERLENLSAIGIFKASPPPFDPKASAWRYDIKSLSADEKKLFVAFVLERVFFEAKQKGICSEVREIVVLDEAHNFLSDDPENILNIIAKEARKFGVALFCASQSPTHFSDDFISNVGCKIILGLDEMFWDGTVRKMRIKEDALKWIIPHKTLGIQLNNKGDSRSPFVIALMDR